MPKKEVLRCPCPRQSEVLRLLFYFCCVGRRKRQAQATKVCKSEHSFTIINSSVPDDSHFLFGTLVEHVEDVDLDDDVNYAEAYFDHIIEKKTG